ncbi:phospholipase D-like domain-containing protein [Hymenobacter jeollabukensis]|uniref:Phospholipase D-like domain-containing protein n=1 Tax=Hymenobacter jeollabukensis TaxID=2025313 RepID=A0A5R8WJN0_9BACT|nr:hypothetical protein [Hymenobacter jeollabukensis]TLM88979.1 hypothetical protein FDY95_22620 [Hymenobacter jeollabukensis]
MRLLPPHKISSTLLDVVLEAKKELVLVSPYVNLTYWKQLAGALTAARQRGVRISMYIRDENPVHREQVEALGISPKLINSLHAKLYYNETSGLVTSLNLLSSSNSNTIEIGYQLESPAELEELRSFVQQHIAPFEQRPAVGSVKRGPQQLPFGAVLDEYLCEEVDEDTFIDQDQDDELRVRALNNTFYVAIEHPGNRFILRGVISGAEADRFPSKQRRHFNSSALRYALERGGFGRYDMVRAELPQRLATNDLDQLSHPEQKRLITLVAEFIVAVRAFKDDYHG